MIGNNNLKRPISNLVSCVSILLLLSSQVVAATRTSAVSGNWSNPATWGGTVPVSGDNVIIASGTTVTITTNTASINDLVIEANATLRGDGTGKILAYGRGSGEDLTNSGTLDLSRAHGARLRLDRSAQWGGTGGTWLLDTLDLNFRTLAFTSGAMFTITFTGTGTPIINPGSMTGLATVTCEFAGSGAQTLPNTSNVRFGNVVANNPAGVSLRTALTTSNLLGDLRVLQGTLSNGGFSVTGNASKQFTVDAGARFLMTSTTGMVTGFGTRTFAAASTAEYGGAGQTVTNLSYGNLRLSGSGTKTLPGTALSVAGDFSVGGSASTTAAAAITVNGSVTIDPSAAFGGGTSTLTIRGNWNNTGTFGAGTSTVMFNGSAPQTISGSSFYGLTVNNPYGLLLLSNLTAANVVTFTTGTIAADPYKVVIGPTGTVVRTSGHVIGRLEKTVTASQSTRRFEIGDASSYTPLVVNFTGVTTPGGVVASTIPGDHPGLSASIMDPARSLNRYYRLENNGTGFASYDATLNFDPADLDAGTDTASLDAGLYAGGLWSPLIVGGRSSSSVSAQGLTTVGDIASAESKKYTIVASAGSGGAITPSGPVTLRHGRNQSFTISPSTGYHIDSVLVDGVSQGAVGSYVFSGVTGNQTIAAYFSIDRFTLTASASAGGSISPSGSVNVNYGGSQSFAVSPSTGYHIDSVLVDGVSQGAVGSYVFSGVTGNQTIAAYFSIDRFTLTASASAGGSISPSGVVSVNYGGSQSFNVTPATGYHVDSVVVDGVGQGAVGSYAFSGVTGNHTIAAYFSIDQFTITASASAGGSISPSGAISVNYGGSQLFTVTPATGYHTDSVVVDGTNQGTVGSYAFSGVTANHSIDAHFSIDQFAITTSASAGGSISPSGAISVNYGGSQSFSVTPATGYHVDSVVVDGVSQGAVGSYAFSGVTANHSIDAHFSIDQFAITASASAGGSISPSGIVAVNYGGSQSFSVTPATGYHVDSVVVDGVSQGAVGSYAFSGVTGNHTIAVYFSIDQFTITASASAGGSISPSGIIPVSYGAGQSFTVSPATGYHVDSVVVDGANQGAVGSYTFSGVTGNHAVAAYFSIDQFTITASASAGGSISPSGTVSVNYGGDQSFTVTPATGHHIDSIVVDGASQGPVGSYAFSGVTGNHTIVAYFSIDQFFITSSASAGGSISPSGTVTVNYGGNQSFTVSPATGYHVDSVVADGVNQGAVGSYAFSGVTGNHTIAVYFSIDQFTITVSASAGGSISPSGSVTVNHGDDQTFTITPAIGHHIDSVLVDGVNQGAVGSYAFSNVTASHALAAYFSIDRFTITASASAGGSISPSGTVVVSYGGNQSFAIPPATGYHIDSVVVDGANQGAVGSYAFSDVTGNHAIAAYFSIDQFTIAASASAGGSISPSGSVNVNYGGSQSFTVSPSTGYHIDSVLVDGANQGAGASYAFSGVTANHGIAAYFSIDRFAITASASVGGSLSPSGTVNVNYGESQSFAVTPATGYHTDSVVVDGTNHGAVSSYAFTAVTHDHTIAAHFSIDSFTIMASASAGGSISPSGSVSVNYGGSRSFTLSPATGYHVDSIVVNGVNQGAVGVYVFTGVTANSTIAAYFSIDRFTIVASASAGGSISPSGPVSVNYGASRSFTVTPATGYHVDSVLADGENQGAVSSYVFSSVTANHAIAAYFSIDQFTITASASAGGSISPSGAVAVSYGATQGFVATPLAGNHVTHIVVDGVTTDSTGGYTFAPVAAHHTISASFAIDRFTITASAGPNGTITPSGTDTVEYGGSSTYTIAAAPGFEIQDVLVDGGSVGVVAGYGFTSVTNNHTITATFGVLQINVPFTPHQGWNIVSVPVLAADYRPAVLFPGALSGATGFHGFYQLCDTVANGDGYWMKFGPPAPLMLTGGIRIGDTINVHAGWNLIGTPSGTVAASGVSTLGTQLDSYFFGFAGAYAIEDVLVPAHGYWVKVTTDGQLVLIPSGSEVDRSEAKAASRLEGLKSMTFTDAGGATQTLYFGASIGEDSLQRRYQLPPVPPDGIFDVRFSSGGLVAITEGTGNAQREYPISTAGMQYPVQVHWSGIGESSPGFALAYTANGKRQQISLTGTDHQAVITGPAAGLFALSIGSREIPDVFSLEQNFPNPFNPGTQVEFRVARPGPVRLAVFDQLGQEVNVLADEHLEPGVYRRTFDGTRFASGVYYYRLTADGFRVTRRMVLVR
jgi:hypothetical protein